MREEPVQNCLRIKLRSVDEQIRSDFKGRVLSSQKLETIKINPKLFWKFEFFVFVIGSLSAYYTFCRMKLLDNEHDERIKERFMIFRAKFLPFFHIFALDFNM